MEGTAYTETTQRTNVEARDMSPDVFGEAAVELSEKT